MVAIHSLTVSSSINQESFLHAISPFTKKVMGVVIAAFAALALCYALYTRCFKQPITQEIKRTDDDSKKVIKETQVAQEKLSSPKHARPPQEPLLAKPEEEQTKAEAKVEESKIIEKDVSAEMPSWTFSSDKIQEVIRLHEQAIGNKNNALKKACEDYFQRAVETAGDHIVDIYRAITQIPELVHAFFDGAKTTLKSDEFVVRNHLRTISKEFHKDEECFADFVAAILEKLKPATKDPIVYNLFNDLFYEVSVHQFGTLARLNIKRIKEPFVLLETLLDNISYLHQHNDEIVREILTASLESGSKDHSLLKLINAHLIETHFLLKSLSLHQLKTLIVLWHTHLNQQACFNRLDNLFTRRSDDQALMDICVSLGIDMEQFIQKRAASKKHIEVCGAYALHVLKHGTSDADKKMKLTTTFSSLVHTGQEDEHCAFGRYLAQSCPLDLLQPLVTILPETTGITLLLSVSMFETLIADAQLSQLNLLRLQKVYEAYWSCWKSYENIHGNYVQHILPFTEEILETMYQAIPPTADKDAIRRHLKDIYTFFPQPNLSKDAIDRILV